jgi:hypothetical protein
LVNFPANSFYSTTRQVCSFSTVAQQHTGVLFEHGSVFFGQVLDVFLEIDKWAGKLPITFFGRADSHATVVLKGHDPHFLSQKHGGFSRYGISADQQRSHVFPLCFL